MTNAVMVKCSEGNELEHAMRDFCWNCAPYWDNFPVCPILHKSSNKVWNSTEGEHYPMVQKKLNPSGYCKDCKKYYNIPREKDTCKKHGIKKDICGNCQ